MTLSPAQLKVLRTLVQPIGVCAHRHKKPPNGKRNWHDGTGATIRNWRTIPRLQEEGMIHRVDSADDDSELMQITPQGRKYLEEK